MGEGGAVLTNNTKLARIIESFRDWGRACYCPPGVDNTCKLRFGWTKNKIGGNLPDGYDHKYTYNHMGFNLKITDMQAACGLAQLEKLESFISKRNRNYTILRDGLKNLEKYLILPQVKPDHHPSWFGFPLTIREQNSFKRHQLINYLNDLKIGTRLLFSGNVINQPYMEFEKYRIGSQLSNANFIMENTFWIGLYPGLTRKMLNFTVSKIQQFFQ